MRAGEPALAFVRQRLGDVEAFPGGFINRILAVDVPARCEAGELVVEELNSLVGVGRGTTCQVVGRRTSANAERFVVAGAARVTDNNRLVLGGRLLARGHDIGQPVHSEMTPLIGMRTN